MREIKFRGLSLRKDKWVYGQLQFTTERAWISTGPFDIQFEVIPETVGQYTGLKDKNGKDIYEGDFLAEFNSAIGPMKVVWENYSFVLYNKFGKWGPLYKLEDPDFDTVYKPQVIGNQYENPELLKQ